jgi:Ca2+-binding EF-hand superfamily protein
MPASREAIGPQLSAKQLDDARLAFDKADEDHSGSIDIGELRKALRNQGHSPTDEDLLAMICEVDEDGSGQIEFDEFLYMMQLQVSNASA